MTQQQWLLNEAVTPDIASLEEIEEEFTPSTRGGTREAYTQPHPVNLAVRLQDIFVWDNRKWFGNAEMRLDVLVVQGYATPDGTANFYTPKTFCFPGVKSGDRLETGEKGLLIYYGPALYFLDIFMTVSRNRQDTQDLATLISQQMQSEEVKGAMATMVGLAIAAPQVATVTAALSATAVLGDFTYKILRKVTGDTIGLYRTSWLQNRDGFGIGRHPEQGSHHVQDLSFWYEIIQEN